LQFCWKAEVEVWEEAAARKKAAEKARQEAEQAREEAGRLKELEGITGTYHIGSSRIELTNCSHSVLHANQEHDNQIPISICTMLDLPHICP
jgi:hypothetical protein